MNFGDHWKTTGLSGRTMPRVFISYAREDHEVVRELNRVLIGKGCSVWRDQTSIQGGQHWPKVIGEAIQANDFVLLVWSKKAAHSRMVEFEWNTAIALHKTIFPCLLDETPLPPALRAVNAVPLSALEEALPQILESFPKVVADDDAAHAAEVIEALAAASPLEAEEVASIETSPTEKRVPDERPRWIHGVLVASVLAVVVLAVVLMDSFQPESAPDFKSNDLFEKASDIYNAGEYDQAAEHFAVLGKDETIDLEIRKESLRYLARAHIAQSNSAAARQAIADLLALEPPLVVFDPDVEPPPLMNIYYELREGKSGYEVPKADPGLRTLAIVFENNSAYQKELLRRRPFHLVFRAGFRYIGRSLLGCTSQQDLGCSGS